MVALVHEVASDLGCFAKSGRMTIRLRRISIGSVDLADARRIARACSMTDGPLDLDKHRGMAAQKATDLRRTLMEAENSARELRDRQVRLESQLLSIPATSWPEAAAKARYILNLYAAGLSPEDARHRDLVAAILDDFTRLAHES
jgi:hypothetical protein